jgi:hypothetical protein
MTPSEIYAKRGFVLSLEVVAAWPQLASKPAPHRIKVELDGGQFDLDLQELPLSIAGCTVLYYVNRSGPKVEPVAVGRAWAQAMAMRGPAFAGSAVLGQVEVDSLKQDLRTAITTIDSIHPRPWEARIDDEDADRDVPADDREWMIGDAEGNTVDGTLGRNVPSNGEWARNWVANVNALRVPE